VEIRLHRGRYDQTSKENPSNLQDCRNEKPGVGTHYMVKRNQYFQFEAQYGNNRPIFSGPQIKLFLLYRGKDRFVKDGILCAPCVDFLLGLRPDQTLDKIFT
jgi:hypothetical protein